MNALRIQRAFTVIELFVTIAVIAILSTLASMSVVSSHNRAKSGSCMSNQRQISVGYALYSADNHDYFPLHRVWATIGGKKAFLESQGGDVPEEARPLNRYVGSPKTFACAGDSGDGEYTLLANGRSISCFEAWGNSYAVLLGYDLRRAKHVTGLAIANRELAQAWPIKGSEIALSPANKLIQGDWIWMSNRRSIGFSWHTSQKHIVLFGDGHVSDFSWEPTGVIDDPTPPDPNWTWW